MYLNCNINSENTQHCHNFSSLISLELVHQQVVRDSILGLGTDEDSLNRAIVTRAEIDLLKVRFEYANMYKSSLDDDVIGDTSGDYRDFLMTLLGKGPNGV